MPHSATDNSPQEEFDSNIHCFCQPHKGWSLYKKPEPPTFFVSVLTDMTGKRRYLATLTFLEPYKPSTAKKNSNPTRRRQMEEDEELDDDDEDDSGNDDENNNDNVSV